MALVTHAATTVPFVPRCGVRITEGATTAFEEHVTCEACKAMKSSPILRNKVIEILRMEVDSDCSWDRWTDENLGKELDSVLKARRFRIESLEEQLARIKEIAKQ